MKKDFIIVVLSLVAIQLYSGCDRNNDGEEEITREVDNYEQPVDISPKHYDHIFDTLVCYPVGTTWEMGYYFYDDIENLFLRSKFELVSDTLIDDKHYKRVKGEFVHLDKTHIPVHYYETTEIWPGIENHLHRLDFYIYEEKGVVTAYSIDEATQRPSYILRKYDFNWPPYIHGLLFYSDGNIVETERNRSNITLLDGNVYEIEDYLVKTIGCVYSMFGEYRNDFLKGRLLNFRRNGVLLYEYGKVELPENQDGDYYVRFKKQVPGLIGTWDMVAYYSKSIDEYYASSNRTTEYEAGTIEWTFYPDGFLYVKSDSSAAYLPFVYRNGTHHIDYATDTQLKIDETIYDYSLGDDGVLTINQKTKDRSYSCTFRKKE